MEERNLFMASLAVVACALAFMAGWLRATESRRELTVEQALEQAEGMLEEQTSNFAEE
jgi:hypothetical protein